MTPRSFDDELADHFRAQRAADAAAAPPFEALLQGDQLRSAQDHGEPARPRASGRSLWSRGIGVALAAAVAAVLVVSVQRSGDDAQDGSFDAACDAALAALLEQEFDARMELPTDALFRD